MSAPAIDSPRREAIEVSGWARASTSSSRATRASGSTSGWSRPASGTWSRRCRPRAARSTRRTPPRSSPPACSAPRSCGSCTGADRWERTPPSLALAAFIGGGVAAPFAIAITGNGAIMSIYEKLFGQAWATDWQAGLTAPFVEETSKGAIVLLLMGLAPVVIRTVSDGLIVGAYVGLGFQILEDVFYAQNAAFEQFGANQSDAVLHIFVAARGHRHPVARAVHGAVRRGPDLRAGHARAAASPRARAGAHARRGGGCTACGTRPPRSAAGRSLVARPDRDDGRASSRSWSAIRWAGGRERAFMRDIMAPEVEAGTITAGRARRADRPPARAPRGRRRPRHDRARPPRGTSAAGRSRRGSRARRRRGDRALACRDRATARRGRPHRIVVGPDRL